MFLLYLFVTGVAAGYCLLAIWVAAGRGPWFARACVLLAALALLVPIRAYEPLVLLGMTSVLLVGGWGAARVWKATKRQGEPGQSTSGAGRLRFRLMDVLLACAVAGAVSWLISALVERNLALSWWRFGLAAAMFAAQSSLAVAVVWRGPVGYGAAALIASIAGAVALDWFVLGNWLNADEIFWILRDPIFSARMGLDRLACLYGALGLWMVGLAAVHRIALAKFKSPAAAYGLRAIVLVAALPMAILSVGVYWQMLGSPRPPESSGEENALPTIMALARELTRSPPERAQVIGRSLLQLSKRPGFSAINWNRLGRGHDDLSIDDLQAIRGLGRQLQAESERLHAAGRHDEAAEYAIANLRVGAMFAREGLVLHQLVGDAIIGIGQHALSRDREQLSAATARDAVQVLENLTAGRRSVAEVEELDRLWSDHSYTWRYRLEVALQTGIWGEPPYSSTAVALHDVDLRARCLNELLTIDLALRAFRAEHGIWPGTLAELVPQYLQQVPLDQYSGQALVYRADGARFVLYSVGKDQKDDCGKFASMQTYSLNEGYDLDVDTMVRP